MVFDMAMGRAWGRRARRGMIAVSRRALLAALVVTLMPTAEAQDLTRGFSGGTVANIPDAPSLSDDDRARITLAAYAACLVKDNRRKVERFLATSPGDSNQTKMANGVMTDDCLSSGWLKFSTSALRPSLFVALYRLDQKNKTLQMRDKPIDYMIGISKESSDRDKQYAVLMTFADCVVRKDPEASRDVILGPTASRHEDAALARLMPSLSPCMPAGATVHFNRTMLYGIIAEALYREVVPPTESAGRTAAR